MNSSPEISTSFRACCFPNPELTNGETGEPRVPLMTYSPRDKMCMRPASGPGVIPNEMNRGLTQAFCFAQRNTDRCPRGFKLTDVEKLAG